MKNREELTTFFAGNPTAKDYRIMADKMCKPHTEKLIVIYLVYLVISFLVGLLDDFTSFKTTLPDGTEQTTTWLSSIFTLLCAGAFTFSFIEISKSIYLDLDFTSKDLFKGFKDFTRSVVLNFLVSLFTALWSLLFIIPGIIKSISYSMAPFIAVDNKELSASECIEKSKKMMEGHKMDYFCLMLSYIGWLLLSILTCGILLLWVLPKMRQASHLFYLKVSDIGSNYESQLNNNTNEETIFE